MHGRKAKHDATMAEKQASDGCGDHASEPWHTYLPNGGAVAGHDDDSSHEQRLCVRVRYASYSTSEVAAETCPNETWQCGEMAVELGDVAVRWCPWPSYLLAST